MTDTNITIVSQFNVIDAGKLSVAELGKRIHSQRLMLVQHARKAALYAVEIGQLLTEAKLQVQHGEWEAWLSEYCHLAPRTARAYMRLAKEWPTLSDTKRQHVAGLPIREALKAIATDPTPPVKYAPIKPLHQNRSRETQDKVRGVFSQARQKLAKAEKSLDLGIKGSEVESLRKHLEAVIAQLDELQNDATPADTAMEVAHALLAQADAPQPLPAKE